MSVMLVFIVIQRESYLKNSTHIEISLTTSSIYAFIFQKKDKCDLCEEYNVSQKVLMLYPDGSISTFIK
jgi:hypothetical protein